MAGKASSIYYLDFYRKVCPGVELLGFVILALSLVSWEVFDR